MYPLGKRDGVDDDDDKENVDAMLLEDEGKAGAEGHVGDVDEGMDCDVDDDGLLRLILLGASGGVGDEEASSRGPSLDGPGVGSMGCGICQ